MASHTLDQILELLNRHHQRATYGAVGAVVDRPPFYLMGGRQRIPWHSWVVSKRTGLPTGFEPHQMHTKLTERTRVLRSGAELAEWLRAPQ